MGSLIRVWGKFSKREDGNLRKKKTEIREKKKTKNKEMREKKRGLKKRETH